jgi:vancomycin permeability regulator SanA
MIPNNRSGPSGVTMSVIAFVRRWAGVLWRWAGPVAVLGLLVVYVVAAPTAWVYASTSAYRKSVASVPAEPVAIVMGAGLDNRGQPTAFLRGRLDIATQLYGLGKIQAILVTGDNSRKSYDEPTAMRTYLLAHGIPDQKIVLDYAGFDTWDSCDRAKRIFGVDRAIVITQLFHLPRAVALCRAAGIRAYGVGDDTGKIPAFVTTTRYGYVREVFADMKAIGSITTKPNPRFLGPKEPGIQRALAAR